MRTLVYIFDVDGTILDTKNGNYDNSIPIPGRIDIVNGLYDEGNKIIYWTARGAVTGRDWYDFTKRQLEDFGCKYHEFFTKKPHYHVWVDDKAINANEFFNKGM